MKDISEIFASNRGLSGSGYWTMADKILPRPTLVAMATKFGSKLAITQLVCKISPRLWHLSRCFRGRAIERCQSNSTTTNPGCHGNEISVKIDYNVACTRDISEILASNRGLSGSGNWTMSVKYFHDRPWLPWQRDLRNLPKISYNMICIKDM